MSEAILRLWRNFRVWLIIAAASLLTAFFVWFFFTGFSNDPVWVAIGVAAISALFSMISAVASWVQAAEAQKQREMHERPYIIGYFKGSHGGFISFVLENAGNSPAVDVSIEFDPAPKDAHGRSLNELSIYREPISFFPPGQSYQQLLGAGHSFLDEKNPLRFKANINYGTVFGEHIEEDIPYDLAYLADAHLPIRTVEESLSEIAKQLTETHKLLKRVEKGGSLMVQSPEAYWRRIRESAEEANE